MPGSGPDLVAEYQSEYLEVRLWTREQPIHGLGAVLDHGPDLVGLGGRYVVLAGRAHPVQT
jgi:hypothetical protein